MGFLQILQSSVKGMFPAILYWTIPSLIPFIVAEQIWPVHARPRLRDYGMNILIALTTSYLALPLGILAGMWSAALRPHLPWKAISVSFHNLAAIPLVGHPVERAADLRHHLRNLPSACARRIPRHRVGGGIPRAALHLDCTNRAGPGCGKAVAAKAISRGRDGFALALESN